MQGWENKNAIYQIYPRSFQDSNGDGVGDLKGITERLPYLNGSPDSLGVDVIWLSPFYTSPMVDFGYDVANYYDVDPLFGTLDDFRDLVARAKELGISVLVDLVPNHTSSEHSWFKAAQASLDAPERDYYIFREGGDDGPPNNWQSVFGGPAWTVAEGGGYYLHIFASEDIGLAGNGALSLAIATFQAAERVGLPEVQYNLYHCALALARSEKSREVTDLMHESQQLASAYPDAQVPLHLRNAPTRLMKDLGYNEGYEWKAGFKDNRGYLPDEVQP